jgi:hypothetical protein
MLVAHACACAGFLAALRRHVPRELVHARALVAILTMLGDADTGSGEHDNGCCSWCCMSASASRPGSVSGACVAWRARTRQHLATLTAATEMGAWSSTDSVLATDKMTR